MIVDDNYRLKTYVFPMDRGQPYIQMKLNVPGAIEIGEFVSAFTSLASAYDRFVDGEDPKLAKDATLFVREVHQGSIVALLVPWLPMLGGTVEVLSAALTVEQFVTVYGARLRGVLAPDGKQPVDAKPQELKEFYEQVAAVASTPNSNIEIAAIEIEDGARKVRAAIKFDTSEARQIQDRVEALRNQIEKAPGTPANRVLMVFTRTDVGTPAVGKSTGERVKIESISDRRLALIYGSELAEQRIKHEIREAEENVYKKGFVVDVNIEYRNNSPVAYSVTNVHDVVDLPDETD